MASDNAVSLFSVVVVELDEHIPYSASINYGVPLGPLVISSLAFLFLTKKARLGIASGPNGTP